MSQHFKFRFRKLFFFCSEEVRYLVDDLSIIFIRKKLYEQKYVDRGDEGFWYISKFEWTVVVDLWIVAMRFRWIGKEQDAKA